MRTSLRNKVGIVLITVLVLQLVGLTAVSAAPGAWAPYPVAQTGMPRRCSTWCALAKHSSPSADCTE